MRVVVRQGFYCTTTWLRSRLVDLFRLEHGVATEQCILTTSNHQKPDMLSTIKISVRDIVRDLRARYRPFGSSSSKSTKFGSCPLWHTVSIFAERQDERPLAGRHFEKTKMAATSAQTCMVPLFRCGFGRIIRF